MPKQIMIVMMLSSLHGTRSLGGVDTVCQSQLQGLAEFGGGHDYLIVAFNPANDTHPSAAETQIESNIRVLWYNYARNARVALPNILANELLVQKLIRQYKPDVVHSHLPCWHIKKYCSEKKILTLHQLGDLGRTSVSYFNDLLHKRLIEPYSRQASDLVTSVSKDIIRIWQSQRNTPIRYIPNAIPKLSTPTRRPASRDGSIRLLLSGTVSRPKRVIDALNTVRVLKGRHTNIKLVVAGRSGADKGYQREIKGFIDAHQLSGHVEFTGLLSRSQLSDQLTRADLAVFFSAEETFGLAPLECLAAGIPLVTTDVGVFRWHKREFESLGVDIVTVGDIQAAAGAIDRRINSSDFSVPSELSEYLARNFSIEACTKMYVDAYNFA